jgi:hypothetical protein
MEFLLEYEDGTISWKSWDKDLLREVCPFNTATPTTSSHGSPVVAITDRAPILIVRPALIGYNGFPSTGMLRLDCPTKTPRPTCLSTGMASGHTRITARFASSSTSPALSTQGTITASGSSTFHDALRQGIHHQIPPDNGKLRRESTCIIKTLQAYSVQRGAVLTYMESLPTCYIWLKHMLTIHVVTTSKSEAPAEDTPCSRTVSILRDLNNVPSRYCTFEFLIL